MDNGDMILLYEILHGFLEGVQWCNTSRPLTPPEADERTIEA